MTPLQTLRAHLQALADPAVAAQSQRYFKTAAGEYGAGDRFLGIRVPELRKLVREHRDAPEKTAWSLLRSPLHEERLLALLMLVDRFSRGTAEARKRIYEGYLAHRHHIDNWDLVDSSAPQIVGGSLEQSDAAQLYELAESDRLWDRRIAVIATLHFIRQGSYTHTLALAERLLEDREDLIHKAVGWMLREVGNHNRRAEERFLARHYRRMPRTMLRYAVEKFPEARRRDYLEGRVGVR